MIVRIIAMQIGETDRTAEIERYEFSRVNALDFIGLDISLGLKLKKVGGTQIVLQQYDRNQERMEYRIYEGSAGEMAPLVKLIKELQVPENIPAGTTLT